MSDAIDRDAVRDEVEYRLRTAAAHYRSCGKHDTDPGDFLDREIEAMTERLVGLLAPAPLREKWGRAYRQADGGLFVDDQDGSFRDRDDVAQLVPPQHPDSPYDLIVKRGVSDWLVSGDDPAVYVVRESDIEDCQRNKDGDWEFRHSGRVFHDSRDPKDRAESLAHHREQIVQRAAIIRAIESEQAMDPVEAKARELFDVANANVLIEWERTSEGMRGQYRRLAAHVLGQEATR